MIKLACFTLLNFLPLLLSSSSFASSFYTCKFYVDNVTVLKDNSYKLRLKQLLSGSSLCKDMVGPWHVISSEIGKLNNRDSHILEYTHYRGQGPNGVVDARKWKLISPSN